MAEELIGIIGGSGLGDALAERIVDAELHDVDTPFGKPSAAILIGRFGKRKIAFLSRHGEGHKLAPSEVPFAANIFAMKKLGVHTVISGGAVGSLVEQIAPGDLVIVDQFIDKTFRRTSSFFGGYGAVHCEMLRDGRPGLRAASRDTHRYGKRHRRNDASERHIRMHGRASVLHAGRIAHAQGMGRRFDRNDRHTGSQISQRSANLLRPYSPGQRLRLLEAARGR